MLSLSIKTQKQKLVINVHNLNHFIDIPIKTSKDFNTQAHTLNRTWKRHVSGLHSFQLVAALKQQSKP